MLCYPDRDLTKNEYSGNYIGWLLVWNIWIIFQYIGNVIIPTDEIIFFRGAGSITNQL
jgi:hypothetical protein